MPVKGNVKTDSAKHSLSGKSEEKNKNIHTAAEADKYQATCEMESEEKPPGESDIIIIIVYEDQKSMKAPANATNKRVLEQPLCHQMTPSKSSVGPSPAKKKCFVGKGVVYDEDSDDDDTSVQFSQVQDSPYKLTGKPRKKKRDPSQWKSQQRKTNRNLGLEYIDRKGRSVPKKQVKFISCKCKYKCISPYKKNNWRLLKKI